MANNLDNAILQAPAESGPLYAVVDPVNNADLTEMKLDGTGALDVIMASMNLHLKAEYQAGRITGNEYTKAYIGVVQAALGAAVQFALGKDAAYWNALTAQQQARAGAVEVVKQRLALELVRSQVEESRYNVSSLLPAQAAKVNADTAQTTYQTSTYLPKQSQLVDAQVSASTKQGQKIDSEIAAQTYTTLNILPQQVELVKEQVNTQRANTADTRTDMTGVFGTVAIQKALWKQQISSYKRDAEVKMVKPYVDAWITMKTMDEGLAPPGAFTNAAIDEVLANLKTRTLTYDQGS